MGNTIFAASGDGIHVHPAHLGTSSWADVFAFRDGAHDLEAAPVSRDGGPLNLLPIIAACCASRSKIADCWP